MLACTSSNAQLLEFVQNKGQWDKQADFRGELANNGALQLQKNGYRIMLNNEADIKRVHNYMHGLSIGSGPVTPVTKPPKSAKTIDNPTDGSGGTGGNSGDGTGAPIIIHSHAYQVIFMGSNDTSAITAAPDKPLDSYNNYFIGSDPTKWASNCVSYQAVTYNNLYTGIDIRYYTYNGSLKYDFIVHPGADPSQIAMYFDGADKVSIQGNGSLRIQTSVGDVNELSPYSYTAGSNGKVTVKAKYVIRKNIVSFQLEDYDKSSTLVIDPTLVFSTFTGSKADNWGFTATYDKQGNLYAGGIVFGNGFPVSNGAYQTSFGGGTNDGTSAIDMGIMKFNSSGSKRVYATYIGGAGNDQPHSMVVDNNNNLIIAGRTTSGRSYPQTSPLYGTEGPDRGNYDIVLTKLNAAGSALVGSRRIGGSGMDGVNVKTNYAGAAQVGASSTRRNYGDDARSEVITDDANNIYLAAQTQSADFPTTPGAFQPTSGGAQDGVVIKTAGDLSNIIFSSYLGGSKDDASFVLALNPNDQNIYVAGGTQSENFPGTGNGNVIAGTYQKGDCDGFVAIISNDGSRIIKSSYFGTPGEDLIFGIQFDKGGVPYITGTTTGTWYTTDNAAFKQDKGKQFISKIKPDLSGYVYSTVFGAGQGKPDISITAFLVDRCENVYVSGWGGGENATGYGNNNTRALTTTPDAYIANSPQRDGADFYFFVLKKDAAAQLYGSMFGQIGGLFDHVDGGTSRFDKDGVIYQAVCANCGGGTDLSVPGNHFPTTAGVWAPVNGTTKSNGDVAGCNLAAIKMAFHLAGISAGLRTTIEGIVGKTSGCAPSDVLFEDTMAMGKQYIWSFGDGTPDVTTTDNKINHTYLNPGNFRARLISVDPSSCNVYDTAYADIRIRTDRAFLSYDFTKVGPCTSMQYDFTNTSTAPSRPFTSKSFVWDFGDGTVTDSVGTQTQTHTFAAAGTYNIVLRLTDTSYCNYPDSVLKQVRISPLVKAQFETPASGCAPYEAEFTNTSLGGQRFSWDFGDGSPASTDINPTHLYNTPGTYIVKLHAEDDNTCNKTADTSFTITVSPKPEAAFSYTPITPEANTPVVFLNGSSGATSYIWDFGDGERLPTIMRDTTVKHIYQATDTFKACLYAANQYGCMDTACHAVAALVIPLVDVPNAFTPNGDGVNDVITLRGYGMSKVIFRIYNRWGVMVFQSNSTKQPSWDGRYKGTIQPQDVYTYIADIEFFDGTKYQKKGDITLLR
ncbi:PKD domain-containing protein [Deminuibacter soli]|uniref:PKD domain-containing protein n=1 Tax=Deminuibacter soli TaxID=2291815 RepID=A0A3E1NHW3_9BACT|nr:PKD domain-containing protein [Deminuibacter soli]